MNLIDANILLYAYDESSDQHEAAADFVNAQLSGPQPVVLSWPVILAFLRIGTNSRAFTNPMTIQEACAHVSSWLDRPTVTILEPTHQHWELLSELLVEGQAGGNLVTDAHLAALALEHGATVCSSDQDFSRFPGLSWTNPLKRGSLTGPIGERRRSGRPPVSPEVSGSYGSKRRRVSPETKE